mmetsp:Transcript_4883/g.31267  ORF Transcript_4883/g.31267 Transcript_4883/m.31267 type:complete len:166 (+) Transcript_4883:1110-1607(+)
MDQDTGATRVMWGWTFALLHVFQLESWRMGKVKHLCEILWGGVAVCRRRGGKRVPASFEVFFSFFLINNVSWLRVAELSHRAVSNHSSFPIIFGCMFCNARSGPINGSTGQEPKLTVQLSECEAPSRSLRLGASRLLSHPPLGLPALPLVVSFRRVRRFSLPLLW